MESGGAIADLRPRFPLRAAGDPALFRSSADLSLLRGADLLAARPQTQSRAPHPRAGGGIERAAHRRRTQSGGVRVVSLPGNSIPRRPCPCVTSICVRSRSCDSHCISCFPLYRSQCPTFAIIQDNSLFFQAKEQLSCHHPSERLSSTRPRMISPPACVRSEE